jgi:hypothetical protein
MSKALTVKETEIEFTTEVLMSLTPDYSGRLRPSTNWSTESGRTKTRIVSHRDSPLIDVHVIAFVAYHIESFLDSNKSMAYKFDLTWNVDNQEVILRFQPE